MLFRENVLLYKEAGALPPAGLDDILAKAKELDMQEVMRQIAERNASAEAGKT